MYFLVETFFKRLHKNKVQEAVGWDDKMIQWCLKEATVKGLRECDFWGGLALDEMKIQVHVPLCMTLRVIVFTTFCIDHASFYLWM